MSTIYELDEQEEIEALEYELVDFTRGATWQRVMRPSLRRRLNEIEKKLAIGLNLELEEIRHLQMLHKLVSQILEEPIKFFSLR